MSSEAVATRHPNNVQRKKARPIEVLGFAVVVLLWIAFAVVLVVSPTSIHEAWAWFTDRSLVMQIPLGILFLPWVIGMWIWEASWPLPHGRCSSRELPGRTEWPFHHGSRSHEADTSQNRDNYEPPSEEPTRGRRRAFDQRASLSPMAPAVGRCRR